MAALCQLLIDLFPSKTVLSEEITLHEVIEDAFYTVRHAKKKSKDCPEKIIGI